MLPNTTRNRKGVKGCQKSLFILLYSGQYPFCTEKSLSDAKMLKDVAEDFVGGELSGDGAEVG